MRFEPRRSPKGTGLDSRQLADAIDTLRAARPSLSLKSATKILAKKPKWRGKTESIDKRAASLESRYYEFKQTQKQEEQHRLKLRQEMREALLALRK